MMIMVIITNFYGLGSHTYNFVKHSFYTFIPQLAVPVYNIAVMGRKDRKFAFSELGMHMLELAKQQDQNILIIPHSIFSDM